MLLLVLVDAVLITTALIVAAYAVQPLSEFDADDYLLYRGGWAQIAVAVASLLLFVFFRDLYAHVVVRSRAALAQELCFVLGSVFVVEGLIGYVEPGLRVPIRIIVPGGALAMTVVFALRLLYSRFGTKFFWQETLLLWGSGPHIAAIAEYVRSHPESAFRAFECPRPAIGGIAAARSMFAAMAGGTAATRIIVDQDCEIGWEALDQALSIRFDGCSIDAAPAVFEALFGRVLVEALTPGRVLYSNEFSPPQATSPLSAATFIAAAAALILLSPLLVLGAVLTKIAFAGPVLERDRRVGLAGRLFDLYRFRSGGAARFNWPAWAVQKLRLCRLPVLFNLLKGDVAIVGPSPDRPAFADAISRVIPFYRHRHNVTPGLTGWAQIRMRELPVDAGLMLAYDLYYIKNVSFGLDAIVILQFVKHLLFDNSRA